MRTYILNITYQVSPISCVYTGNEATISGSAIKASVNDSNVSIVTIAFGNSDWIEFNVFTISDAFGGPALSPFLYNDI